jgi:hypothetical protein
MQQLLLVLLLLASGQGLSDPILSVQISVQPQPLSFLGFYDSIFPVDFTVVVTNTGTADLPAGDLTLRIDPPSKDRYSSWLVVSIPTLSVGSSFQGSASWKPLEPGVHTVVVYSYSWAAGRIEQDNIRYNYTVVDLRGPEIVYGSVAGIVVAIAALLVALRRRSEECGT